MRDDRFREKWQIVTATLADVAREAGVGESTASRVLRAQGSFSEATREKVGQAAARLGYVPNRVAGSLASAGSNLIAIIIPSLANIVFPDVLRGADAALSLNGFQSVVGVTGYDAARETALIRSMLAWRPAGLMLVGLEHSAEARAIIRGSGIRVAEILDIDGHGIDLVVGFSNEAAGHASGLYLLERGYRRIGYVGHDLGRDRRGAKRLAGFSRALSSAGTDIRDREIFDGPSSIGAGRECLQRLLARSPELDAVYFSNDDMAIGGYFHCLANGIAVPDRLALFGYNGLDVGRHAPQPLSTVKTPRVEIGEMAAALLCSGKPSQVVDTSFELIQGATS